jgi:phospholipase/lecithinase/hemolysin
MRTRTALAAALLVASIASHGATAAQFGGVYFFGDSLSDAGSFKPLLPPGTGKFTTILGRSGPKSSANVTALPSRPRTREAPITLKAALV